MNRASTAVFEPITWAKWFLGVMVVSSLLAFIPLVYDVAQERLTPRDYWFTYHAVQPVKSVYKIGEDLTFYSARTINKTALYEWHDTLKCDTNGVNGIGDRVFSIFKSGSVLEPHVLPSPGGIWTYHAQVPDTPAVCYLISTTTAKLRYTDKVQTLVSDKFEIR